LVSLHHGPAWTREPADIASQASCDALTVGDCITTDAKRIAHACILLVLSLRGRDHRRECEKNGRNHSSISHGSPQLAGRSAIRRMILQNVSDHNPA
jgi:hypothetical protein